MVVSAKAADPSAARAELEELVRRSRSRAVALAYHLTGDEETAKDVAQDAFVRAFRSLGRFRGEAAMSTWLLGIVVREAARARRRAALRSRWAWLWGEEKNEEAPPGDPGMRRRIGKALDTLTLNQRVAFSLVHLEGMTVVSAAEVMGCAVGTLKSHLHRALGRLREELGDLR